MHKLDVNVGSPAEILDSITDAFYYLTDAWKFSYINRQASILLGFQPEELIGKVLWDVYPGLIGTELETAYRRAAASGISSSFVFFFPDHARWYEVHCYPSSKGLSAYFRNVTEKIERDRKLEESENQFRLMSNAIPQILWITDAKGQSEFFNQQWYDYTGNTHDLKDASQVSAGYIHPDDRGPTMVAWEAALRDGHTFITEHRIRSSTGSYRWFLVRGEPHRDPATKEIVRWYGTSTDVHDKRMAEEAFSESEQRYSLLLNSMDAAFSIVKVLIDEKGKPYDYRFEQVNPAFEKQSGLVNAAGKTIREMVPNIEQRWIDLYGRIALSRESARFNEHSAAMGYWWDVYAAPIGTPEQHRIAIVFTDITARIQGEETLRQYAEDLNEANQRKTHFLATLAHELRNPLAPIRTGLDLLRVSSKNPENNSKVLDMMGRQLDQMVHLINDLMDISRINSGKVMLKSECFDLREAVNNAVEAALPSIESSQHRLDLQIPAEDVMVDGDQLRLAQVITNLLVNAAKYTGNGGTITLSLRKEHAQAIVVVSDTGLGIPAEELTKVFEMFSQVSANMGRAHGGLGIGLSLVKSLVEMHGGEVFAESPGVNQGSSFTVKLKTREKDCADTESATTHRTSEEIENVRFLRILIADDNVDAAHTLSALLESIGHHCSVVHDGQQALQRAIADIPDLAILDIGMPILNGYEVATRLRDIPALNGVVLAALTGWSSDDDRQKTKESGFNTHLTKPVSFNEIKQLVEQVVFSL